MRQKLKHIILFASIIAVSLALCSARCVDLESKPVCPKPVEYTVNQSYVGCLSGVDLLVVVDKLGSIEQEILATGLFTLINSLVDPVRGSDWRFPPVDNMRVAVVSSDLGLQYGEEHSTKGFPYGDTVVPFCTDRAKKGDDGVFQTDMEETVDIISDQITCEDDGNQCPSKWTCADGTCVSPSKDKEPVNCPDLDSEKKWAETSDYDQNPYLSTQVSCLGNSVATSNGCSIEQQLETAVRALSRNDTQKNFMKDSHMLAVLIVSAEEDCSIEDRGIFETKEWKSGIKVKDNDENSGLLNTACNLPKSNEESFLFETERYWNELISLKNGQPFAVVFAAIVGVPPDQEGIPSPCQGRGNELSNCLSDPRMQLEVEIFRAGQGVQFKHFSSVCERKKGDVVVTSAKPGRRYVEVAQEFTSNGSVYSICNADWSPAMKEIARTIAEGARAPCYAKPLTWIPVSEENCKSCGISICNVVVKYVYNRDEDKGCPPGFNADPDRVVRDYDEDEDTVYVYCPLPKLTAEFDCEAANMRHARTEELGWYYCEDRNENFEGTCRDGIDNDEDGNMDCNDEECKDCKDACGGTGRDCHASCKYQIEFTAKARNASRGQRVVMQCPRSVTLDDENCQENTYESCNDGKDNDGNHVWDCNNVLEFEDNHFADPHCCPMTGTNRKCDIDWKRLKNICEGASPENIPDACKAHARMLKCYI